MSRIMKCSGELEEFDVEKIRKSVYQAYDAAYISCQYKHPPKRDINKVVSGAVKAVVYRRHDLYIMTTDEVREAVEKELMKSDYYAAKEYMLFKYKKGSDG